MRKLLLTTILFAVLGSSAFAQGGHQTVAEKRAEQREAGIRPGEEVEYCGTHWKMQEMMEKHPAMKAMYEKHQQSLQKAYEDFEKNPSSNPEAKAGTVYTIPVVFHILHQNGVENISHAQIEDALAVLNRDYRLLNSDASMVHSNFSGMPADAEIEFAFATIAPDGSCFNGVTRTYSYYTFDGSNGSNQIQAIVDGNDVYQGTWPGDEYMNIYVAVDIGGAAGYTTNPGWSGTGMGNGIWVQQDYVGSIGTGSTARSRTLTHEVGHWLNLSHCWGPNNNPGDASSCSDDDGVNDTPECIGVTTCNLSSNTCTGDNSYWGFNQIDNVENYMEYSYCSKMFTQGQVNRMRSAITSSSGGRNNLWTTSNLAAVGADATPTGLCKADFNADEYEVCSGDSIQFTDFSYNNVTGWTWTFTGGSPSSSTDQNPKVEYATAGVYPVTLEVTNGTSTTTTTKSGYITVLPGVGRPTPFTEGFESIASLPHPEWFVENQDGAAQWEITSVAAATGSKSIMIDNSTANSGSDDSFISNTIDLEYATAVTLNFKYAFAKRTPTNADKIEVWASSNCGQSWALRKNISSAAIGTAPEQGGNFVPSSSEWADVAVTNINSTFWTPNFRFKIVYVGGGGNNIYLDDINLDVVLSVEGKDVVKHLNIYPNPFKGEANIEFDLLNSEDVDVQLFDMVGKLITTDSYRGLPAGTHKISLDAGDVGAGVYMVRLKVGEAELTRRVVIE